MIPPALLSCVLCAVVTLVGGGRAFGTLPDHAADLERPLPDVLRARGSRFYGQDEFWMPLGVLSRNLYGSDITRTPTKCALTRAFADAAKRELSAHGYWTFRKALAEVDLPTNFSPTELAAYVEDPRDPLFAGIDEIEAPKGFGYLRFTKNDVFFVIDAVRIFADPADHVYKTGRDKTALIAELERFVGRPMTDFAYPEVATSARPASRLFRKPTNDCAVLLADVSTADLRAELARRGES